MPPERTRRQRSRASVRHSVAPPDTQPSSRSRGQDSSGDEALTQASSSTARHLHAPSQVSGGNGRQMRQSQVTQNMRYVPYGNAKEKRELRTEYRNLLESQKAARLNIADVQPSQLADFIEQSSQLFEKVVAPSESVLDSRLLLSTADMGAAMAKSMKVGSEFNIEDYLTRCAKLLGGKLRSVNELDREDVEMADPEHWKWDVLGRKAARRSRRAVTTEHLLGPLEISYNKRTFTRRAAVDTSGPAVKPVELTAEDMATTSANETTAQVSKINRRLIEVGGRDGVNLFKFVINPHSFSDTVENLFYVSFLIKDGHAALDTENDGGEPLLLSCESATTEDHEQGVRKRQIILELDMHVWRQLIEQYDIRAPMIEPRKADQTVTTDTWQRAGAVKAG